MNRQKSSKPRVAWAAIAALAVCLALPAVAGAGTFAEMRTGSTGVDFQPQVEYGNIVLTVSGPDGYTYRAQFGAGESPFFSIYDETGAVLPDGNYHYELTAAPTTEQRRDAFEANQTFGKSRGGIEPLVQSGAFSIAGGAVVSSDAKEPGAGANVGGNALATKDQVIADDLIVQQSLCVGVDCVNGENFGFDTIRLKENNLRIKFEDTSVGSFPSTDWELTANDSSNGGANRFSITDVSGGTTPFTVEGGSASNTLYVDSGKKVGINTSTPVVELHVVDGDSPTLRLEQNASSGFAAQTWDVAGNETNFFVRDATNGSKIPFKIIPNAPNNSLYVASSGNVGIGTASPSSKLHVKSTSGTATAKVEEASGTELERNLLDLVNNGNTAFQLEDTSADGSSWQFKVSGPSFRVNKNGTGGDELVVRDRNDGTGQATLVVNGSVQATNVTFSSSRSLKEGFVPVDPQEVLAKVTALPMTMWQFKADTNGQRHLGPIAEDFHEAFGLGASPASISAIDASGVAMAAIQGLQQELQDVVSKKDQQIDELRGEVSELRALLREMANGSTAAANDAP